MCFGDEAADHVLLVLFAAAAVAGEWSIGNWPFTRPASVAQVAFVAQVFRMCVCVPRQKLIYLTVKLHS